MTRLLEEAIEKLSHLPDNEQNKIARMILDEIVFFSCVLKGGCLHTSLKSQLLSTTKIL